MKKYPWTVLNVSSIAMLLWIVFKIYKDSEILLKEEGWGMVAMFGLAGLAIIGLLIDLVLRLVLGKRKLLMNAVGAVIVILALLAILKG